MRKFLIAALSVTAATAAMIGIPALLGSLFHRNVPADTAQPGLQTSKTHRQLPDAAHDLPVRVYLSQENRVVTLPLEHYVCGVVAAEMPIRFDLEALKAQAVAARTNVIRSMADGQKFTDGADVSDDFHSFQAFKTDEALKKQWGADYNANMAKITEAVADTQTEIMNYQGSPIDAKFFSTSNGKTESSQAYFGADKPYLQSVPCPWDADAPHNTRSVTIPLHTVLSTAGEGNTGEGNAVGAAGPGRPVLQVLGETPSHHVEKIRIGDRVLTGPDFRGKLNDTLRRDGITLDSTDFTFFISGSNVTFVTHGFGHDVGMSQYGADGMAKEGKTYREILTYFYKGIQLESYSRDISRKR